MFVVFTIVRQKRFQVIGTETRKCPRMASKKDFKGNSFSREYKPFRFYDAQCGISSTECGKYS